MTYKIVPLSLWETNWETYERNGWELVGYSEYDKSGRPKYAELQQKWCPIF